MQFGAWPLVDPNPAISPFFLQPSVMQGLSSFRPRVEESVQTKDSASVFASASFWNDTESLWHCWPPVWFDSVETRRPAINMGHHVKEENRWIRQFYAPFIYIEPEYYDAVTSFAPIAPSITYPMHQYYVNINKKGRFKLNHPLMDVASKMPLLISLLLPAKAENNSRKMHAHPRRHRKR